MDTLSTEQATEIYQLAAECQALGSDLAKQFQNLSGLETMHPPAAQAAAHKTINVGCMACSTTFGVATATQKDQEHESSLHRLCAEANQTWKDVNKVIFSHLLRYDSQLVAFISAAEGTLQAKCDEIWRCIHSLTDTANIPHRTCLPLAPQTLDQLPTILWDLSYYAGIPLMFAYGPESYNFQTWRTTRHEDYLLENDAQATNLLSHKLVCMAGRTGPDDPSPSRAASPACLAGSAAPLSPAHSPSRSCSRTPTHKTEKERSCFSSTSSRRPNPSPQSPQVVKIVMTATQLPNRAASLKNEMRQTPMVEPQVTAKAQMVVVLMVVAKFQMLMARKKTDGEANESSSEAEGSGAESGSSSSESDDQIPTKATPPMGSHDQ